MFILFTVSIFLLVCHAAMYTIFYVHICSLHLHEPGPDVDSKMSEVIEGIVEDQTNG